MLKNIKLLIVDDNKDFCKILNNYFSKDKEIKIVGTANNGLDALDKIDEYKPDVVVLDIIMPHLDGIGVLEKISLKDLLKPKVIMLTAFDQEEMTQRAIDLGVKYYLLKPFDLSVLRDRIKELGRSSKENKHNIINIKNKNIKLDIKVTNILNQIGIPININGYLYLRDAVLLAMHDIMLLSCITKELYPTIAQKYKTTPTRVEGSIRHAIDLAWKSNNNDLMNISFGYMVNTERNKPTNSELIALLADKLRLKYSIS